MRRIRTLQQFRITDSRTEGDNLDHQIEGLLYLYQDRWGVRSADELQIRRQTYRAFFTQSMLLLVLYYDGHFPVAGSASFTDRPRRTVVHHTGAYNSAYSQFSPGKALDGEIIQWAIESDFHTVDFGAGGEEYKYKLWGETNQQRCWVHKPANIMEKLPKAMQPKVKETLHNIWQAETRKEAYKAFDDCIERFSQKYPNAMSCLAKDKDSMLAFYDYPAENWQHIRTTNPIESVFATVRLRTAKTKNCGSRLTTLAMAFKLMVTAQKNGSA